MVLPCMITITFTYCPASLPMGENTFPRVTFGYADIGASPHVWRCMEKTKLLHTVHIIFLANRAIHLRQVPESPKRGDVER